VISLAESDKLDTRDRGVRLGSGWLTIAEQRTLSGVSSSEERGLKCAVMNWGASRLERDRTRPHFYFNGKNKERKRWQILT
jgi:hypothetical protein